MTKGESLGAPRWVLTNIGNGRTAYRWLAPMRDEEGSWLYWVPVER